MHKAVLLVLVLSGCVGQKDCVEMVETGEYALKVDSGIVRLVETNKLVKAKYHSDDYIYVDRELCRERDEYGDLVH